MEKKNSMDIAAIILIAAIVLYHLSPLFDHQLKHDFPYGMMASDTFQHQTRAESIKLMDNYKWEAPWIVAGFTDNPGFYQPIMYHLGVLLSHLAGLETYDTAYYVIIFLLMLGMIGMYVLIRKFHPLVAFLSIPLMSLVFMQQPTIGLTWGHWPSIAAQGFLIGFLFSIMFHKEKGWWVIEGILLVGIFLAHSSEAIFAVIVLVIAAVILLVKGEWNKDDIASLAKAALLAGVISFWYGIIFWNTLRLMEPLRFIPLPAWNNPISLYLKDFGIILIVLVIGMALAAITAKKKLHVPLLFSYIFIVLGYTNYIGFGKRSFQFRMLWPVYLSLFFGIALYSLIQALDKKARPIAAIGISLLFIFLFIGPVHAKALPHTVIFNGPGLMDQQHWDAFEFIQENTPKDASIYFLYGDMYSQNAVLRNAERTHYQIDNDDYIASIQNATLRGDFLGIIRGDSHGVSYTYRKGLLEFGHYKTELGDDYFYKNYDICTMDYVVLDTASRQPVIAKYNTLIANEMVQHGTHQIVFNNGIVAILKNIKKGETCIEPKKLA